MSSRAVVLLSGGMDSATVAAMAQRDGYDIHAMSFRYGQRHAVELEAAKAVVAALDITEHRIVDIDLGAFGGSALTDDAIAVPKAGWGNAQSRRSGQDTDDALAIPVTYVPARNTIFLAFALAYAEVIGSSDIFIGVNVIDYSGYPDCRPEFIAAFETLGNLATKRAVEGQALRLHAPLLEMSKADIVEAGVQLGIDHSLTVSCYDPGPTGTACGACDACALRREGFITAGVADPTRYGP